MLATNEAMQRISPRNLSSTGEINHDCDIVVYELSHIRLQRPQVEL